MLPAVKFQQWYEQYAHIFTAALRDNCSAEYALYLSGNKTNIHGAVVDNGACTDVQNCIWDVSKLSLDCRTLPL
jgi:hypothetical protein